MVTLADKNLHEIGYVKDANFTADVNGEYEFSVQIARSNWYPELNFPVIYTLLVQNMVELSVRS